MADYNLSYTGAQLDEAIRKMQAGYILPSGTISIGEDENNQTIDVSTYAQANVSVPIPSGYIIPSGNSPTITTNGTHNVKQYVNAVVNVDRGLTEYNSSTYSVGATNKYLNDFSLYIGFRPKVFVIYASSGVQRAGTTATGQFNPCIFSMFICDDSYSVTHMFSHWFPTGNDDRIAVTSAAANTLRSSGNYVKGNSGTKRLYFANNQNYEWHAWG